MVRITTYSLLAFLSIVSIDIFGQNSVGIGTPTPNSKAVLELVSPGNNQGLLVPKLTTTQRTSTSFTSSLTTKENGLLVFDSDDQKFYYWQTNQWLPIRSGSDSALTAGTGITITGNTISVIPDGDGSATNELQDLQLTGNSLKITGNSTATPIDLSTIVLASETQNLQLTGNTLKITGNPSATPIDLSTLSLADNSATNEIQDLQLVGSTLTITNNPSATPISLAAFTGTDTDQQTLSYNSANGQLSITRLSGGPQSVTVTTAGTAGGDLTGTFPNPTIGTGKVTSTSILDGTIATADLANTSVTDAKVAAGISVSKVTAGTNGQFLSTVTGVPTWTTLTSLPPNGTAGGDLTGTFPNPTINANAVTSAKILDGTIVNADIANVDASKITAGTNGQFLSTVTGVPTWTTLTSLPPNGTAGGDLTGSFPNPTINANAITSAKILDGTIVNADIANVDASKITTGTLPLTVGGTGATTATGARTNLGLGTLATLSTVTTTEITDGTIVTVDLANTSVTDAKIAAGITPSKISASATNNQVLTTVAGVSSWANLPAFGTGSVTNIATGTGLTGGPITTTGTIALSNTGVGAATYGSATQVPVLTVDLQGRITAANTVTVTTSGAAGGDLTGTYPNPTIGALAVTDAKIASGITPSKISASSTNNQVLTTVAGVTSWANLPASGTGSVTNIATGTGLTGGPITTTGTIALSNTGVGAATYGSATQVPVLTVDLQGRITGASTATAATPNLSAVLTSGNNAGGTKITNLGPPTVTTDATTKAYVDNLDANDLDKSSTNEIQDLKSVLAQGNDANASSIVNVGAIGIGTNSPKTNLSVVGSHSVSFTAKTGSYTIKKDDYLIISDGAGAVVTLPPAAEVPGRVLIIRTLDNDKGLDVRPNTGDKIDGATLIKLFDVNGQVNAITVVADGKDNWWIVSNSVK